jgi:hypothetical protein
MARPQVADGGTDSDREGSCEYIYIQCFFSGGDAGVRVPLNIL